MDKAKREDVGRLERLAIWFWDNRGDIAFFLFIGTVILAMALLLFGLLTAFAIDSLTSPEQRFENYNRFYIQCLEQGIYPEDCNAAALDYAGLEGAEQ
jgi:hypothetical protein